MADDGFYLLMLEKHEAVESAIWQCYTVLFNKLGYFNANLQVTVDGKKVPLKEDVFTNDPDPSIEPKRMDFFILRSMFIKVFEDGTLLLKLVKDIAEAMGEKTDDITAKASSYSNKSNPNLRAVYWYIDRKFLIKMPMTHQVSFAVDNMMFGSWRLNSSNTLAMHLVILALMINVKQFATFVPPDLAKHASITNPPFKGFLEKKFITMVLNFKDVKSAGAGAGVAKTVDKAAKGAKDAKKDAKGAKDDKKKGAKDDKKGAKADKKGAKDVKKKK